MSYLEHSDGLFRHNIIYQHQTKLFQKLLSCHLYIYKLALKYDEIKYKIKLTNHLAISISNMLIHYIKHTWHILIDFVRTFPIYINIIIVFKRVLYTHYNVQREIICTIHFIIQRYIYMYI